MAAISTSRISDPSAMTSSQLARLEAQLLALGVTLPPSPTPAQMRAGIADFIGTTLKNEIDGDPEGLGYAGAADDDARASLMLDRRVTTAFLPQTQLLRRTAVLANLLTVEAENGAPIELSQFLGRVGLGIRFYSLTPTVALRDTRVAQSGFLSDVQIELTSVPLAMTDNDLFRVEVQGRSSVRPPRLRALYEGIPLAPNDVTGADITAAKA